MYLTYIYSDQHFIYSDQPSGYIWHKILNKLRGDITTLCFLSNEKSWVSKNKKTYKITNIKISKFQNLEKKGPKVGIYEIHSQYNNEHRKSLSIRMGTSRELGDVGTLLHHIDGTPSSSLGFLAGGVSEESPDMEGKS